MTCDILQTQLTALLDNELSLEMAAEAEQHLALCPNCAQALAELTSVRALADAWTVDAPDISERVMQAAASDDPRLLLGEMRHLRTEIESLRAEVAALRRQLGRRTDPPLWTPPARLDYQKLENDPWNLIRS